jgi:hypothetical protein
MTIMETSGLFLGSPKKPDRVDLTDNKIINQAGFFHKNGH